VKKHLDNALSLVKFETLVEIVTKGSNSHILREYRVRVEADDELKKSIASTIYRKVC